MLIQRLAVSGEKTRHVPYKYKALGKKKERKTKNRETTE
jgi:hypothetical protein